MKKVTLSFGFATKDLTTLQIDLRKCNSGILPAPHQIKKITIKQEDGHLLVDVQIFTIK